ncbi:MAG: N-acetyltransferase [Planctomycetota bacterium]|nr:MAG: N-acetyltransferase [Planctomycetota bacterium]
MAVEVVEAQGGLFKKFLRLPWRIYRGDSNWVPPLLPTVAAFFKKKHPFWQHGFIRPFVALRNGEVVGRIAAIVNHRHNQFHNDKTGFWGFFECEDNTETAQALFERAEAVLKEAGCDSALGPVNPSTNDECALLIDGFDSPPTVMMPYNPPYYARIVESCGYRKAKDLVSYIIYHTDRMPKKVFRVAEIARRRAGIQIRPINMRRLRDELEKIKVVYNDAWQRNWGFVPMTDEEIDHMARELKHIAEPDLVLIAEHEGEPAGFSLTVPNINEVQIRNRGGGLLGFALRYILGRRRIRRVRIMAMGVRERFRVRGIDAVFYVETFRRGVELGYTEGEMGWVLEDNKIMRQTIEAVGGKLFKKYRLYIKNLTS